MTNSEFFRVPLEKIQVAADQTILTYASVLPNAMAHLKPYGPHCSGNMSKMANVLKLQVPARSEVSRSIFVSLQKAVFRAVFRRKSLF